MAEDKMKDIERIIVMLVVIFSVLAVIGSAAFAPKDKFAGDEFPPIENKLGVEVDYESGITIRSYEDIEDSFNEYIDYCQREGIDIFGYTNNWRFDNASIHGTFDGVRYFSVNASWYDVDDGVWHLKSVFDVSENGEIVRFLGQI